jgi:hypothetical protein
MYTTKRQADSQASAPPAQGIQCAAYGCPLPGGISLHIGPGAIYYCRFHDQADPSDWNRITHQLRMNIDILQQWQKMNARSSDAHWLMSTDHHADREQAYSFPDCPKEQDIDHFQYVMKLNTELRYRIFNIHPSQPITRAPILTRPTGGIRQVSDYLPSTAKPQLEAEPASM